MVAKMSKILWLRVFLYLIMLGISYFLGESIVVIILVFIINVLILNIIVWTIPINLNWSSRLYNHNLYQIIITAIIVVLSFAFIYKGITVNVNGSPTNNFIDCLHLSISMFSGLGYGEVVLSKYKIVSSLQSVIGLCYLPILAAYIWMYIQNMIRTPSHLDEKVLEASEGEVLSYNHQLGILEVKETEEAINSRNEKFQLNICNKCKNENIDIVPFIEPRAFLPLKKYICQCSNCGNISNQKNNVYYAVNDWNKKNIFQ